MKQHVKKADVVTRVKRRSRLWKAFMLAAVAVVFTTTYMLILPALTLENNTICGEEEHTHTEACYKEVSTLTCATDAADHQHTADCYHVEKTLICGREEHTHSSACYADETLKKAKRLGINLAANSAAIDFTDWITAVSMEQNGQPLSPNTQGKYEVDDWATVKFAIQYQVPARTLSTEQNQISYQLPFKIKNQETGNVYDSGTQAGTYVITADGLITITFNSEYVTKNVNGSTLTGAISFSSQGQLIRGGQDIQEKTIRFNSSISYIFAKPDSTQPEDPETTDLSAKEEKLQEDGTRVQLKTTLSSVNGTGGSQIAVSNNLWQLALDSVITIKRPDGSTYTATAFPLTLNALSKNQSYEITYWVKSTVESEGRVQGSTTVQASWTGSSGKTRTVQAGTSLTFGYTYLAANAAAKEAAVTWSVTVNQDKGNISGAVLKDSYLNTVKASALRVKRDWNTIDASSGDYTVQTDGNGYVTSITFQNSANAHRYDIEYDFPVERTISSKQYENTVTLTNAGKLYTVKPTATYSGYKPVSNQYKTSTQLADGSRTIDWNAEIKGGGIDDSGNSVTPAGFQFEIDLDGTDHVFTKGNLQTLADNLGNKGTVYAVTDDGTQIPWNSVGQDQTVTKVRVTVTEQLDENGTLPVKYQTRVKKRPTGNSVTYKSTVSLRGDTGIGVGADYTYQNPIISNDDKNPTEVTIEDLEKNGYELSWENKLKIPEDVDEDVLIVNEIPDGTEGQTIRFLGTDLNVNNPSTTITYNGTDYTVKTDNKDGKITLLIPKELVNVIKGQEKTIVTTVLVDQDNLPTEETDYQNKVSFSRKSTPDEIIGVVVNTTTVGGSVFDKASLQKQGSQTDEFVHYRIFVNPSKYVTETDTKYYVRDTFKYGGYPWTDFSLVPSSVKVYKEDGKTPLSSYLYSYVASEETVDWGNKINKYLDFTIDYGGNIIIEYTYKLTASTYGGEGWTPSSTETNVVAIGKTTPDEETADCPLLIYAQKSEATVTATGLTIYKIDESNANTKLSGAEFDLYKYNGSAYAKEGSYTSDENGAIALPQAANDTAYKLVETKAPTGYQLPQNTETYFWVSSNGTSNEPTVKPAGFAGEKVLSGGYLYISNKKEPSAQVLLQKVWIDKDGEDVSAEKQDSVAVVLYRATDPNLTQEQVPEQATKVGDYTITGGSVNQWYQLIDRLPLTDGVGNKLYYYAAETGVNGYDVSYVRTAQYTDELGSTKIVITNTEAAKEYVLPHTGGSGTAIFAATGLLLTGSAAYYWLRNLRKRKEGFS